MQLADGIPPRAPSPLQFCAATHDATRNAGSSAKPRAFAAASPPMKASPAPVVSTTSSDRRANAGTKSVSHSAELSCTAHVSICKLYERTRRYRELAPRPVRYKLAVAVLVIWRMTEQTGVDQTCATVSDALLAVDRDTTLLTTSHYSPPGMCSIPAVQWSRLFIFTTKDCARLHM